VKKIINLIYNKNVVYTYFLLFPMFEMITSIMVKNNIKFTFGMIYKFVFIIYSLFYIIFINKKNRKINISYIILLCIVIIMSLLAGIKFSVNDIISIKKDAIATSFRYINFPIVLLFFYYYIQNNKKINKDIIVHSIGIYCLTIIIAIFTKTSGYTYEEFKLGYKGYFYAGNEVGNLLAIMFPICLYAFCRSNKIINKIIYIIEIICVVQVGTKTAVISVIATLFISIIYSLIVLIIKGNSYTKKLLTISLLSVIALCIYAPYSAAYKIINRRIEESKLVVEHNIQSDLQNSEINGTDNDINTEINNTNLEIKNTIEVPNSEKKEATLNQVIYSGRQELNELKKVRYKDSSIKNKLFGMEFNKNCYLNPEEYKLVERDFHDILYIQGAFGLIVFCVPIFIIGLKLIIYYVKRVKLIDIKVCLYGTSCMLALGISYMAGHCLLTPSISMYVAYIFVELCNNMNLKAKDVI